MKQLLLPLLFLIFFGLIIFWRFNFNLGQNPPVLIPLSFSPSPSPSKVPLKVLASIPYWDQTNAVSSFKKNVSLIDKISLFWYVLGPDGQISKYKSAKEDLSVIDFAHKNGVEVFALIANLPDSTEGSWDSQRVNKVISSKESRGKHINDLVRLVVSNNFDGLNLDYEALTRNQREDFSDFVDELALKLHENNKKLGIAIHPKTEEFKVSESYGAHAQDLERISKSADELYFMTYEEHNNQTRPGPIASNTWVKEVLSFALNKNKVENNKLFLGIPLYGYDWTQGGMRPKRVIGLEYSGVLDLINKNSPEINWSEEIGESSFTYQIGNTEHEVWFNDVRSVESKLKIREDLNLGGIHIWRLGQEDPEIWEKIRHFRN